MSGQLVNAERRVIGCFLVLYFLFVRLLPVCAEVSPSETTVPINEVSTFEQPNTIVKTTVSLYKQIRITAKPVDLKGSLKGKYKAYYYTLQNQSADAIHIKPIHHDKALSALESVQYFRKHSPYVDRFFGVPVWILFAGGTVAFLPLTLAFEQSQTTPVIHSPLFALAIAPVTTPVGLLCMGASIPALVVVASIKAISIPIAATVGHHNDKISLQQIKNVSFKEMLTPITLKPRETTNFILVTPNSQNLVPQPEIQID